MELTKKELKYIEQAVYFHTKRRWDFAAEISQKGYLMNGESASAESISEVFDMARFGDVLVGKLRSEYEQEVGDESG